jgi:hypothetical protein
MIKRFKGNHRLKRTAALALGLTGVVSTALAIWFVLGLVQGTGSTKVKATSPTAIPIVVTVPSELGPGGPTSPIMASVNNEANPNALVFHTIEVTVTNSAAPGCPNADFKVAAGFKQTLSGEVLTLTEPVEAKGQLELWTEGHAPTVELIASAPQACEGTTVSVKLKRLS